MFASETSVYIDWYNKASVYHYLLADQLFNDDIFQWYTHNMFKMSFEVFRMVWGIQKVVLLPWLYK